MHLYMMGWKCCRNDPHATDLIVSRGVTSSSVIFFMSYINLYLCASALSFFPGCTCAWMPLLLLSNVLCPPLLLPPAALYQPWSSGSALSFSLSLFLTFSSTLVPATSLAFSSLPLIHFTNFPVMFPVFTVIHLPPHIHFWLTLATGHNFKMWYM